MIPNRDSHIYATDEILHIVIIEKKRFIFYVKIFYSFRFSFFIFLI